MKQGAHGGNIYEAANYLGVDVADIYDYSSNVAPFTPDIELGKSALTKLPEPYSKTLTEKFAVKNNLSPENVCISSGTTEVIESICRLFPNKKACITNPTYADYKYYCDLNRITVVDKLPANICFICNPNNPTGKTLGKGKLISNVMEYPETLFVIDESYMPFHMEEDELSMLDQSAKNLVVLRSFSKIYGLPGIRLGAVVAAESVIGHIKKLISPWSVNSMAQSVGLQLLDVDTVEIRAKIHAEKENFLKELSKIDFIMTMKSDVNYILCKLKRGTSVELFAHCLQQKVLIRDCANFEGLDDTYVRFAVTDDMNPLLTALRGF